ncbi:hypothetical protein FCI23_43935 [Actinacidiphila oryziradicis]|uniref:Uncharacterized protein n=1 Tax=Actinacidiphila oryziradicis TaxID=2571141 RepID=A0A4U0RWM7_9ACTN|nr:hypothetical protein FCI23_43935 [Actinacidiphila oryziradicis]
MEKTGGSGITELRFLYENTPQAAHQRRSRRHTGACRLNLAGRIPTELAGRYYTDRFTAGDMDLVLIGRTSDYSTFAQGAAADTATPWCRAGCRDGTFECVSSELRACHGALRCKRVGNIWEPESRWGCGRHVKDMPWHGMEERGQWQQAR